jgi:hypothetical protein
LRVNILFHARGGDLFNQFEYKKEVPAELEGDAGTIV